MDSENLWKTCSNSRKLITFRYIRFFDSTYRACV
ncbi:unnamed protein product [Callosobruchus maculatus]|uniref:Uncharacterized protein n=1 Tax=Callosobruchus maculatus TaxID=64391 RepID=A0A653DWD2_CALMS|nr:unnamed protein product [Callosobruchus maculatus]